MLNKLLIVIALFGGALAVTWYSRSSLESQIVSDARESLLERLPAASFQTLDGSPYDLIAEQGFSQKMLLVHFWATWCGPCEAELPVLLEMAEKLPESARVLIVAVNDEVPKIRKFMDKLNATSTPKVLWLLDNKNVHREVFGTTKLPESYVFKGNGEILRKLVGPQEWEKPQFIDMFAAQ